MSESLGFIAALIAISCWGSQFVPLKKLKNPDMIHFQLFMSIGTLLISVILTSILGLSFSLNYFGLAAGIMFALGNIIQIFVVNKIGLAKGAAIPLGTSLVISFLFGIFFFNEPINIFLGILGIAIFLIGLPFVTYSKEKVKANKTGIIAAFVSGIFFGSILIFFKLGNLGTNEFLFPLSLGFLLLSIVFFISKGRKIRNDQITYPILSGVIWGTGMLSAVYAVAFLGLAIGQPLTQLALLIAVLWGLFYFKEIREKKATIKVLIGSVL